MHALLNELIATPSTDPTQRKIADLYAAWMDEAAIEKRGIKPLQPDLERIAAAKTRDDLMLLVGDINISSPIGFGIRPDPADTSKYMVFIGQAGLGMGRDYYTNAGPEFDDYRRAYLDYIGTILELLGQTNVEESAAEIFDLETKLANVHWTPAQSRDVKATYNPMNRGELIKLAPQVDWPIVLAATGLKERQDFVVTQTSAIAGGAALLDTVPLETWKKYMTFHRVSDSANMLPRAFDEAHFEFYSKTMRGTEEQRDRWKRGVTLIGHSIGEGLGQAYVAKYFPPAHKAKMDELVQNLLTAMKLRIEQLSWMDDATRAEALVKLASFDPRVGYPNTWRDYSMLTVEPGKLFESAQNAREFEWNRRLNRLDKPVDRKSGL